MNQINLDKLLQNPAATAGQPAGAKGAELKLLASELYTARLNMLSANSHLQIQTPQGKLVINLPEQLSRQLSQQFGNQLQVRVSPGANNQLNLSLQSLPVPASSIVLNQAQLPAVISQWLTRQLPQQITGAAIAPSTPAQLANQPAAANNLTVPLQLDLKTGQLRLAETTMSQPALITLSAKEIAAVNQLAQSAQQPASLSTRPIPGSQTTTAVNNPHSNNLLNHRLSVLLTISFHQQTGNVQLSLQPAIAQTGPMSITAASQQQLLQALISQLAPVKYALAPAADKISVGQLNISIPPQLAATLGSLNSSSAGTSASQPTGSMQQLLVQLQPPASKNGQWQLVLQPAGQNQQLVVNQNQADRAISWQASPASTPAATDQKTVSTTRDSQPAGQAASRQPLAQLSTEIKAQAWRNLLPLLSQPLMQPGNMPNLPAPLQQLFSQVQQSLPEISKPLAPPAIASQLAALMQFQPLQSQPNLQTTGGTLALAIQLLLGHLSQKQLTPAGNTTTNRLSQLVSQLDNTQASAALRQLSSLSSPLQQSQLATLDAQSQLQQWLLQLPLQQQGQTIMPQLLVEQREAEGQQGSKGQKQWQLTMKFDLQQYGNLLAVAKLQEQDLQLQFYTDHNQALRLAQKFLPLLKDRCAAQGLTVTQAQCQLGKIPDSLIPRHNSLLTVRV
ncbi:flagellar hook-length control protein FliK [Arsukibacterium indicum]|uniref:Flagellar hook-length control protein FliK n=1 Tax=Arsukibacterium indicum TaxID=2848612 RepID=A0ABS6MG87_9GAMM|nr:flagellar hook-length control protein FliK [Arsukibacterium indicum]MBV2127828.1 flagellar hook-length control protein FliK [Arsukibacterium indicum]